MASTAKKSDKMVRRSEIEDLSALMSVCDTFEVERFYYSENRVLADRLRVLPEDIKSWKIVQSKVQQLWTLITRGEGHMYLNGALYLLHTLFQSCDVILNNSFDEDHCQLALHCLGLLALGTKVLPDTCLKSLTVDVLCSPSTMNFITAKEWNLFNAWTIVPHLIKKLHTFLVFLGRLNPISDSIGAASWSGVFASIKALFCAPEVAFEMKVHILYHIASKWEQINPQFLFIEQANMRLLSSGESLMRLLLETIDKLPDNTVVSEKESISVLLACEIILCDCCGAHSLFEFICSSIENITLPVLKWAVWGGIAGAFANILLTREVSELSEVELTSFRLVRRIGSNFSLEKWSLPQNLGQMIGKRWQVLFADAQGESTNKGLVKKIDTPMRSQCHYDDCVFIEELHITPMINICMKAASRVADPELIDLDTRTSENEDEEVFHTDDEDSDADPSTSSQRNRDIEMTHPDSDNDSSDYDRAKRRRLSESGRSKEDEDVGGDNCRAVVVSNINYNADHRQEIPQTRLSEAVPGCSSERLPTNLHRICVPKFRPYIENEFEHLLPSEDNLYVVLDKVSVSPSEAKLSNNAPDNDINATTSDNRVPHETESQDSENNVPLDTTHELTNPEQLDENETASKNLESLPESSQVEESAAVEGPIEDPQPSLEPLSIEKSSSQDEINVTQLSQHETADACPQLSPAALQENEGVISDTPPTLVPETQSPQPEEIATPSVEHSESENGVSPSCLTCTSSEDELYLSQLPKTSRPKTASSETHTKNSSSELNPINSICGNYSSSKRKRLEKRAKRKKSCKLAEKTICELDTDNILPSHVKRRPKVSVRLRIDGGRVNFPSHMDKSVTGEVQSTFVATVEVTDNTGDIYEVKRRRRKPEGLLIPLQKEETANVSIAAVADEQQSTSRRTKQFKPARLKIKRNSSDVLVSEFAESIGPPLDSKKIHLPDSVRRNERRSCSKPLPTDSDAEDEIDSDDIFRASVPDVQLQLTSPLPAVDGSTEIENKFAETRHRYRSRYDDPLNKKNETIAASALVYSENSDMDSEAEENGNDHIYAKSLRPPSPPVTTGSLGPPEGNLERKTSLCSPVARLPLPNKRPSILRRSTPSMLTRSKGTKAVSFSLAATVRNFNCLEPALRYMERTIDRQL